MGRCQLCLEEKVMISTADPRTSLNKRSEIIAKCRHRKKFLLATITKKKPVRRARR